LQSLSDLPGRWVVSVGAPRPLAEELFVEGDRGDCEADQRD
jgi:hypothetical protein